MRTLIWNGRSRKAPEIPPMEVKNEIIIAIKGGNRRLVVTPDIGNVIFNKSIEHLEIELVKSLAQDSEYCIFSR